MGKIFDFIVKHIAVIASIVVSAVITMNLGPILMAKGALGAFWGTVATGAVAGFASGVIMTGSLKGGLAGAMWGAVAAGFAYGGAELAGKLAGAVNSAAAHTASLIKTGLTKLTAIKTLLHGLSSGIINYIRGGSFRAGFFSGLGSAFDIGTKGYGGMVGRTSIMAIIGGTFARLGGGKFANGALSAAFVHLFNASIGSILAQKVPPQVAKQMTKKELEDTNFSSAFKHILSDGAKGAVGGAIAGGAAFGPPGVLAGLVLGLGGGLVTGAAMESFGVNSFIDTTIKDVYHDFKNLYHFIKGDYYESK